MTDRGLLQISKLEDFKSWLDSQDIPHRPGKGEYEVLQVFIGGRILWTKLYRRLDLPRHFTVQEALTPLVRRFIAEASVKWEPINPPSVPPLHNSVDGDSPF